MKTILTLIASLICFNLHAYEATAETTDQKIDGVARQLSHISANFDQQFGLVNKQTAMLLNQLVPIKESLTIQQKNIEQLLQVLKEIEKSIEKNNHTPINTTSIQPTVMPPVTIHPSSSLE